MISTPGLTFSSLQFKVRNSVFIANPKSRTGVHLQSAKVTARIAIDRDPAIKTDGVYVNGVLMGTSPQVANAVKAFKRVRATQKYIGFEVNQQPSKLLKDWTPEKLDSKTPVFSVRGVLNRCLTPKEYVQTVLPLLRQTLSTLQFPLKIDRPLTTKGVTEPFGDISDYI